MGIIVELIYNRYKNFKLAMFNQTILSLGELSLVHIFSFSAQLFQNCKIYLFLFFICVLSSVDVENALFLSSL